MSPLRLPPTATVQYFAPRPVIGRKDTANLGPDRDDGPRDLSRGSDAQHLVRELRRAGELNGSTLDSGLCTAVSSYTLAMKDGGYPVEHVVISLKQAMNELGFLDPVHGHSELRQAVITFCIEDFYRDGHPR